MPALAQENKITRLLVGTGFFALLITAFALYVHQSTRIEVMMQETHMLYEQRRVLISETETLQAEVSRLSNVDRISSIAAREFGLVFDDGARPRVRLNGSSDLTRLQEEWKEARPAVEKRKPDSKK